jgi:NADPH2:quinone reductase
MRAVVFAGAGGNEVVRLEERDDPVPSGGEVLVHVRYAGLNPADLAQRAGRYPAPPGWPPDIPGIEVAGTVAAVGPNAQQFEVGTRVFGIVGGGGLAERVIVHERHVTAVPENLDDVAATAAPEAFLTAHDAVMTQAQLRPGELLVVNGGNGGVGTAAIQVASVAGARVLATVRSEALRDRVAMLGADVVAPDEMVEAAKARGGADVVLELVGAPNLARNFEALSTKGRIVIVGTGAGDEAPLSLRLLMMRPRRRLRGRSCRISRAAGWSRSSTVSSRRSRQQMRSTTSSRRASSARS